MKSFLLLSLFSAHQVRQVKSVLPTPPILHFHGHVPNMSNNDLSGHVCSHIDRTASQSLDELMFERGAWTAALDGDTKRLEFLIRTNSCCVNSLDSSGYTPLHYAARAGHVNACKVLLDNGAEVHPMLPSGDTPLHRASYAGHIEVVKLLITYHKPPSSLKLQGADGETPLHKAAARGHFDITSLLVESFPSMKCTADNKGRIPIHLYHDKKPQDPAEQYSLWTKLLDIT